MMAETSTAPPKCTTVGVPKALIDSAVVRMRRFAMSATTTNWDERLESSECSQGTEDEPARARHDSRPHFFWKTSLATEIAVTAFGQPA